MSLSIFDSQNSSSYIRHLENHLTELQELILDVKTPMDRTLELRVRYKTTKEILHLATGRLQSLST
jgi:hypothetical protein